MSLHLDLRMCFAGSCAVNRQLNEKLLNTLLVLRSRTELLTSKADCRVEFHRVKTAFSHVVRWLKYPSIFLC